MAGFEEEIETARTFNIENDLMRAYVRDSLIPELTQYIEINKHLIGLLKSRMRPDDALSKELWPDETKNTVEIIAEIEAENQQLQETVDAAQSKLNRWQRNERGKTPATAKSADGRRSTRHRVVRR